MLCRIPLLSLLWYWAILSAAIVLRKCNCKALDIIVPVMRSLFYYYCFYYHNPYWTASRVFSRIFKRSFWSSCCSRRRFWRCVDEWCKTRTFLQWSWLWFCSAAAAADEKEPVKWTDPGFRCIYWYHCDPQLYLPLSCSWFRMNLHADLWEWNFYRLPWTTTLKLLCGLL